ncbi:MAG: hypothetical protein PHQ18_00465 [Patescibacteria group bacterium]|nr:hypothetical protein [Patescibacteria group bacterium]
MGSFNRDGKRPSGGFSRGGFGGGRPQSRGGFGGGRDGDRPTMHPAVCEECGNDCEVPFKPTGSRPVFCSNCFGKQQGDFAPKRREFGGDRPERRDRVSFDDRQMHDAVCDKCGGNCQVPFRPTPGKEIFCDKCFGKGGDRGNDRKSSGSGSPELLEKINMLNSKVDKLMELLGGKTAKAVEEPTADKKISKAKKEVDFTEKTVKEEKPKKEKTEKKVAKKKVATKKKK